jgi:hypothetical protein
MSASNSQEGSSDKSKSSSSRSAPTIPKPKLNPNAPINKVSLDFEAVAETGKSDKPGLAHATHLVDVSNDSDSSSDDIVVLKRLPKKIALDGPKIDLGMDCEPLEEDNPFDAPLPQARQPASTGKVTQKNSDKGSVTYVDLTSCTLF